MERPRAGFDRATIHPLRASAGSYVAMAKGRSPRSAQRHICLKLLGGVVKDGSTGLVTFTVNHTVHRCVTYDDLNVFASFRERYGFDELGNFIEGTLGFPEGEAIFTGVVSRGSVLGSAGRPSEVGDIEHAEFDVDRGIEERGLGIANLALLGEAAALFQTGTGTSPNFRESKLGTA